jgi:FAD/FMN-containing dehydrogenase
VTITSHNPVVTHPSAVTTSPLEALRQRLTGQLITPDSPDFDAARTTINRQSRVPLAIARVASAADVAAAVDVAREHHLPLAVRGGGHSIAGFSMVDDSLVIDFTAMKRVTVDPVARTARVQPGATSGDLAGPASEHGLALSTGDTSSVGMGGLVTGGGVGFMARKYGLAIDNLIEAEVVTAGGEILTASETSHPALFWAIRGGGGNVGIVTEFTFRLASVPQILGGVLVQPATREVVRGYLQAGLAAPDDLTTLAHLMPMPPLPFAPPEWVGKPVVLTLVTWTGEIEAGQEALAPLRALAEPVAEMIAPMPYPAMYDFTAQNTLPHGASIRMMFADDLSDGAIDAMLDAVHHASSETSIIQLRAMGGAFGRVPRDATAFAHRDRNYFVAVINVWFDTTQARAPHEAWTEALWSTIRPEGTGVYVNFLEKEGPDRVREAYPDGTYERLQQVKAAYDPQNLFRFNQNVPPTS